MIGSRFLTRAPVVICVRSSAKMRVEKERFSLSAHRIYESIRSGPELSLYSIDLHILYLSQA
jgi:hypothetical protein